MRWIASGSFLVLGLVVAGCDGGSELTWRIEPAPELDAARLATVLAEIRRGSCAEDGDVVYTERRDRSTAVAAPRVPALPAGRYAFAASGRDDECERFADGCVTVVLPTDETVVITVLEETLVPAADCAATACEAGWCAADRADAGPGLDGGPVVPDAGSDGGGTDGGSVDGGPDAGPPLPSACSQLPPGSASGAYAMQTGGEPWEAYCEMDDDSGGWTLVLKIDGNLPTFGYDAARWEDTTTLNPGSTDASREEAKLAGFHLVPFDEVRIVMRDESDGRSRSMIVRHTATSLRAAFSGGYTPTTEGRSAWLALMAAPELQTGFDVEGFNVEGSTVWTHAVRLGIVGNNEPDADTPDSRIGIGGRQDTTTGRCGGVPCPTQVENTAGNAAMCIAGGCVDTRAFAWVYVR